MTGQALTDEQQISAREARINAEHVTLADFSSRYTNWKETEVPTIERFTEELYAHLNTCATCDTLLQSDWTMRKPSPRTTAGRAWYQSSACQQALRLAWCIQWRTEELARLRSEVETVQHRIAQLRREAEAHYLSLLHR